MDTEVSYAGITKRSLASVIDRFIMTAVMCLITFLFIIQHYSANKEEAFDPNIYKLLCVSFTVISTLVLEALLITRFSGTPGQLLCGIHMKHANTFKNLTLMQAIIRCVSREVILVRPESHEIVMVKFHLP
ncbi:RDD family protein [Wolbachia endosymbiont (group A) of Cheilosia soror]|uniref:RDD family protein n=1 Tax=Wolbachia endosymbiont (group A) of Cheilosia soror TaxID=2953995 RepID=UPI0021F88063|nr:RDD family protein [Wolbachia endosymbiont (group A) of Cheilosia soror]